MSLLELSHEKWMGTPMPQGYPPVLVPNGMSQCRLSLTSNTPVTTADVTGASALLLEAYLGNRIVLPTEWGEWRAFALPRTPAGLYEVSHSFLASSPYAISNATVYDVFAFLNRSGQVDFEIGPAWSSATARATAGALGVLDGARVLNVNPTRLLVGTIYASAANATEDSAAKRFVWNAYNRRLRRLLAVETTASWTYTTATWRQANAATANQVDMVRGLDEDAVQAEVVCSAYNNSAVDHGVGIGVSSTSVDSGHIAGAMSGNSNVADCAASKYNGYPGIGRYFLAWLERSVATGVTTWYGTRGDVYAKSGIRAEIWA